MKNNNAVSRTLIPARFRLKESLTKFLGEKGFLLFLSILVGFFSGAGAVAMKHLTHFFADLSGELAPKLPGGIYTAPLIPIGGILLCLLFVGIFFRKKKYDKSLACVITSTANGTSELPPYKMFSHILTSGTAVGLGSSAGLEAPSALTGCAIGSNFARFMGLGREARTLLLACGGAAGISAIFDSPVAGALFACEILLPSFSVPALVPLLIASASASVLAQLFSLPSPFIQLNPGTAWTVENIPYYFLFGIGCGLVSSFVIKGSLWVGSRSGKVKKSYVKILSGFLLIYLFFLFFPCLKGEGYKHIAQLIKGEELAVFQGALFPMEMGNTPLLVGLVILLVFLKPLISAICIESGGDGGIFGPSLFTGAFLGYGFARLLNLTQVAHIDPVNCVAVGMGGVLAGVMHAPLTGIFLIAELTGGYKLFVPLMIVAAISSFISKLIARHNVYKSAIAMQGGTPEVKGEEGLLKRRHLQGLVEQDFHPVKENDPLRVLLQAVMQSKRNLFPVLDEEGHLTGVINMDQIRPYILQTELYDVVLVYDLMAPTGPMLDINDSLSDAVELFESLRCWNLPVIENGRYMGFVSKAGVFEACRTLQQEKQDLF